MSKITLSDGGDISPAHRLRSKSKYILPLPPKTEQMIATCIHEDNWCTQGFGKMNEKGSGAGGKSNDRMNNAFCE